MNEAAKEARREYRRKWAKEHPENIKRWQKNYWEKRAKTEQQAEEGPGKIHHEQSGEKLQMKGINIFIQTTEDVPLGDVQILGGASTKELTEELTEEKKPIAISESQGATSTKNKKASSHKKPRPFRISVELTPENYDFVQSLRHIKRMQFQDYVNHVIETYKKGSSDYDIYKHAKEMDRLIKKGKI